MTAKTLLSKHTSDPQIRRKKTSEYYIISHQIAGLCLYLPYSVTAHHPSTPAYQAGINLLNNFAGNRQSQES